MGEDTSTTQFFKKLKRTVKNALMQSLPGSSSEHDTNEYNETESSGGSRTGETEDDDLSSTEMHSARMRLVSQREFPPTHDDPHAPPPLFWNPSILSTSLGKTGDSLLLEEIDEAGIRKELSDEERIEEIDRKADQMHEQDLWMEIGLKRMEQDGLVMAVGANQPVLQPKRPQTAEPLRRTTVKAGESNSLRFRRPGGALKSRVYIDSDEGL